MKFNWKKIAVAGFIPMVVFTMTGCMGMILDAYKEIEPCAFTINPPTKNDFVMLISDSEIKNNIIGTWKFSGSCQCFAEIDINGKPFMYKNTPGTISEETMEFLANGKLHMIIRTKTINPQTKEETVDSIEQTGTWLCKNGLLRITAKNTQTGEDVSITAIATWPDRNSMDFRMDIDSFQKIVRETTAKAQIPKEATLDGIDCHYDDDWNLYLTMKMTVVANGMTCKSRIITKQPPKIFTRQN